MFRRHISRPRPAPERDPRAQVRLTTDPAGTARRRQLLDRYFAANVLGDGGFCCTTASACRTSVTAHDAGFFEGQLSYVGPHYDACADGVPLRVLIVPMEVGSAPARITMEMRDEQVLGRRREAFRSRNPHMRGVTLALRLAFGQPLDEDPAGELLGTAAGPVHLFDAYAMANLLLCSAAASGRSSRATAVMRANCVRHLAATIGILQPTLVISQGATLLPELTALIDVEQQHTPTVATGAVGGHRFTWVALHHPTHTWDWLARPYLHEVAAPAIALGRRLALGEGNGVRSLPSSTSVSAPEPRSRPLAVVPSQQEPVPHETARPIREPVLRPTDGGGDAPGGLVVAELPPSYANKRWAYARAEYLNHNGRRRVLVWSLEMRTQGGRGRMALREDLGATDLPGTTVRMSGDELMAVLVTLERTGRITFGGDVIRFPDHLGREFVRLCRNRMEDARQGRLRRAPELPRAAAG